MTPADTLRSHGVMVDETTKVPGRPYQWAPLALLYHWTGSRISPTTHTPSLGVLQHGRSGIPGPMAHWLVGRDGTWHWITDGYANHAGKGSRIAIDEAIAGRGSTLTARDRGLADEGSGGNRNTVGIELENSGSEPVEGDLLEAFIGGMAALCDHYGFHAGHVISHATYTARKVDWPPVAMSRFRRLIEERLALAQQIPVGPLGRREPRHNPPVRIDARWRDWCIIDNGDGTHGLVALGEHGDIYAFDTPYRGAPNNEIQGRAFTMLGDAVRVRPSAVDDYTYEIITDLGYSYGY